MCFSAAASFAAAVGLGAIGVETIRNVKDKSRLPMAAMPLLFGAQQAVEGVVWVTSSVRWIQLPASFLYVMFSHVLWPTWVPLSVLLLEKPGRRRTALRALLVLGIAISSWLVIYAVQVPVGVTLSANGCIYDVNVPAIPYGLAAYVLVTCVSCLISSHKFVRLFGISMIGALSIALWAYLQAFYSVWCFFAAILSFMIYFHMTGAGETVKREVRKTAARAEKAVRDQMNGIK